MSGESRSLENQRSQDMIQKEEAVPPPVVWAQRRNIVFVTICLEDCKDPIIKVEPQSLYFKGLGGTEKKMHEVTINLYEEIDAAKTVQNVRDRIIEIVLTKKEGGPYWPRLTKDKTRTHWLRYDFNKWDDENDSGDDKDATQDFVEMFRKISSSNGSSYNNPDLDCLDSEDNETDSDDEYIPNLE